VYFRIFSRKHSLDVAKLAYELSRRDCLLRQWSFIRFCWSIMILSLRNRSWQNPNVRYELNPRML